MLCRALEKVQKLVVRSASCGKEMGRTRRRQKQQCQGKRAQKKDDRDGFPAVVKKNEEFDKFYKRQTFIPEGEWDQFMATLAEPLPTTFRVAGAVSRFEALEFMRILQRDYFPMFNDLVIDDEKVEPPHPLEWYTLKTHAWKIPLGRSMLRKNPKLKELHSCIRTATESGHISRQEAVSMIPPLLLDVQSHHKILDMCAAPGSKTAQIVEMLHQGCDNKIPDGFVIANDVDNNRCYTMTHQIKRLQSPCVIMINENAASMPAFLDAKDSKDYLFFDRILADVPCSGDGTMRKNLDIWHRWNLGNGRGLHTLQKRILFRGVRMLAVGGRIVYSTCSFNPLENEAVVASALRHFNGCIRLVDVSKELPGLKRIDGISKWSVYMDPEGKEPSYEDCKPSIRAKYRGTMWPPTEEEAKDFNLNRCIRLLPHHNDTGGFFIAVLEKVKDTRQQTDDIENEDDTKSEIESKTESESKTGTKDDDDDGTDEPPAKRQRRFHGYKEDPFIFFKEDEIAWPSIKDFYQLKDDFPYGQFLGRCEGPKRNIYFTSGPVKHFMDANADRFKFINLGVKALSRNDSPHCECKYRLTQDAIGVLSQFVTERVVHLEAADISTVLCDDNPFIEKLSHSAQCQLLGLKQGGLIFKFTPKEGDEPQCSLTLCGWKGMTSVRSFTPKLERQFYLLLCGNKDFTLLERPRDNRKAQIAGERANGAATAEKMVINTEEDQDDETEIKDDDEPKDENETEIKECETVDESETTDTKTESEKE